MAKLKLLASLLIIVGVCAVSRTCLAKATPKAKCDFNGNYSFFFWIPTYSAGAGVGFFTVQLDPATDCRSGVVLPGGILNCNIGDLEETFEDFI
jgi:hypothetical protein